MQEFEGGLGIGQRWRDSTQTIILRVVAIDPALHVVEVEDASGHVERDNIDHFVHTHFALAC
jgi:hypothetical protein